MLMDPMGCWDRKECWVPLGTVERRVRKAHQEQKVNQVNREALVVRVPRGITVTLGSLDCRVLRENLDQKRNVVFQVNQVSLVVLDLLDNRAMLAPLASKEWVELLVPLANLAVQEQTDYLDKMAVQVPKAQWAIAADQEQEERRVMTDSPAQQAPLVPRVGQAFQASRE